MSPGKGGRSREFHVKGTAKSPSSTGAALGPKHVTWNLGLD